METNQNKIAIQKLALLFFLQSADMAVSERRLSEASADLALMDYFDFKINLHDICDSHLASRKDAVHGRFYEITEVGRETLRFFLKELLYSTRQKIDAYCTDHKQDMQLESTVFAEYIRIGDDQFRVVLRILENNVSVFELSFFAASRAEADRYVSAWRKKAMEIYKSTFENLLS